MTIGATWQVGGERGAPKIEYSASNLLARNPKIGFTLTTSASDYFTLAEIWKSTFPSYNYSSRRRRCEDLTSKYSVEKLPWGRQTY